MISICIPIYNRDVKELIDGLYEQSSAIESPIEIVLIDDASEVEYREKNKEYCVSKAKYIQLDENIGRSRIRNLFLQYTIQPYLVFLDCDVVIPDTQFVQRYFDLIKRSALPLAAGGHYYSEEKPSVENALRWRFGIYRESPSAKERSLNPYKSFKTSNFMVARELFQEVHFNENIDGYGHEDTVFGYEIKMRGIAIRHIENPVLIIDLDTNVEFIDKTKRSIENLVKLLSFVKYDRAFINDVKLLSVFYKLKNLRMLWIIYLINLLFSSIINRKLLRGNASLRMFDFYKLAYLSKLLKNDLRICF